MTYKLASEQIEAIYKAVLSEPLAHKFSSMIRNANAIAQEGWCRVSDVEEWIGLCDRRLDKTRSGIDFRIVGKDLGLSIRWVCDRNSAKKSNAIFWEAWSTADAAALLIALEQLGFVIDPRPFVEVARMDIIHKQITDSELSVLWYDKTIQKAKISIESAVLQKGICTQEDHTLRSGYKITALGGEVGIIQLSVRGPRYRRRRPPIEEKCQQCGYSWWRGDPDSSAEHRRIHRRRMRYLEPKPCTMMKAEIGLDCSHEHVDWTAPKWKHREMYERAAAFKREEGYDFVQWDQPDTDTDAHGFLFTLPDGTIVGACAFRLRKFESGLEAYGLQWVWISPRHRRQGVLRKRWNALRERFGAFWIEPPVSAAMERFVAAMGDDFLLEFPPARSV